MRCRERYHVRISTIPPFPKHIRGKRLQWLCVETVSCEFPTMKTHAMVVQAVQHNHTYAHAQTSFALLFSDEQTKGAEGGRGATPKGETAIHPRAKAPEWKRAGRLKSLRCDPQKFTSSICENAPSLQQMQNPKSAPKGAAHLETLKRALNFTHVLFGGSCLRTPESQRSPFPSDA